jgi:hypothetical protein
VVLGRLRRGLDGRPHAAGHHFLRNEFFLDLRGQRTSAIVEKIVTSKTDVIHIAYTPAGTDATVRTTVQSLFGDDP